MTHYIDKDALVAEIERLKSEYVKHNRNKFCAEWSCGVLDNILSFIDTLEVKDVDLDKEIDRYYNIEAPKEFEDVLYKDIEKFAEHFFELGLKAQKGG